MMPVPVQRSFTNVPEGNAFESDDVRWPVWAGSDNNLPWADILKSERVLIIAQAGSGKSHECRQCQKRLWEAGEPAFFLELGTLATTRLEELLLPEEETRLQEWRTSQSLIATFFLDSVDELAMTHGSFRTALTRLKRALGSQIARARIVITSRPVPVDRQAVEEILPIPVVASPIPTAIDFANIVMGLVRTDICAGRTNLLRTVLLLPLSDKEIEDFAVNLGVTDPERLLQEIHRRNAKEFAERPLDLIGLCSQWRQHGRIGSHREQVASDVRVKLRPAADRAERAPLSEDKAFEGATRLALAATLMRRLTFRHSAQADIGGWRGSAIDPAEILPDWSAEERVTLLQRPLFGFASYGRVRFHHRSVVEYLAAARLAHHISCGVAVRTIKRLLFTKTAQGEEVVRPTLRPVATWLALENEKVFVEMCRREPGSLLELGDPGSMSLGQKKRALSAYVERYGGGGWRGLNVPAVQVRRFAEPHLATHIAQLWPTVENPDVRDLLLELVAAGPCPGCADMAYDVVRSPREPGHLRLTGLDALICMSDRRLGEVMQALESDPSQWPNEIARPAVVMLFPSHLTAERLLSILRRLTDRRNSVSHLNYFLPQRILGADMDRGALTTLRQGLVDLVSDGIKWERNWPHYRSSRPFLIPALGAACVRQFGSDISGMALSVSLVLRVAGQDFESDQPMKALRALVADADGVARGTVVLG